MYETKTKITHDQVEKILNHKDWNLPKLREETGLNEYIIGTILYADRTGLRKPQYQKRFTGKNK